MEFVDTHCHLYFEQLKSKIDDVIENAKTAKVTRMICAGTSIADSAEAARIAASYEGVWAAVGVHPHEAAGFLDNKDSVLRFNEIISNPKVVAAGEMGLDYYKSETPRDVQQKVLRAQIEAALPAHKPFIFHVRDAWSDFWRIYDEYAGLQGVIHSFSSGTKDHAQLDAAKKVPLDKLLLETDAPFLTPEPFRGEVCEPKHVAATAEFLSKLRKEPLQDIATATTQNARKLFRI
jgi:TatD DNase family protein